MAVSTFSPTDCHAVENPAGSRYYIVKVESDSATQVVVHKSVNIIDKMRT